MHRYDISIFVNVFLIEIAGKDPESDQMKNTLIESKAVEEFRLIPYFYVSILIKSLPICLSIHIFTLICILSSKYVFFSFCLFSFFFLRIFLFFILLKILLLFLLFFPLLLLLLLLSHSFYPILYSFFVPYRAGPSILSSSSRAWIYSSYRIPDSLFFHSIILFVSFFIVL